MPDELQTESKPAATSLTPGGLLGTMEVITPEGLCCVADLTPGTTVYALNPTTGVVKQKPIHAIRAVESADLVTIETRRADLQVAAAQRLPFTTRAISEPRIIRADAVGERAAYKFVNDWQCPPQSGLSTVDVTDYLDDYEICATTTSHGHTFRAALPDGCEPRRRNRCGYYFDHETFTAHQTAIETIADTVSIHVGPNHHRRPYRFDGDDFLRLLGWYVTEGSVYWPEESHTAQIKIAQETAQHRRSLTALFERLGIDVTRNDRRFEFGSVLFGRLLERLCGSESQSKRLPALVWDCARPQQRLLWMFC